LELAATTQLKESKHKRFEMTIAARDHGYCDGAQYKRKDRYLDSPFDTCIYILQNKVRVEFLQLVGNKP
jgi:hypothetical protein